jgi:plastocyanin
MKNLCLVILLSVLAIPAANAASFTFSMYASYNGTTYSEGETLTLSPGDTIDFTLHADYKGYDKYSTTTYDDPAPLIFGSQTWLASESVRSANKVTDISYDIDFGVFRAEGRFSPMDSSNIRRSRDFSVTYETAGSYLVDPAVSLAEYLLTNRSYRYAERTYFLGFVTSSSTWTESDNSFTELMGTLSRGSNDGHGFVINVEKSVSPVPVPGAAWLLGSGLIGLMGLRQRQPKNA